jgi:uncharacterized damage-inducible protein DinB
MKWFERSFPNNTPAWMYPSLLERLRGTPARLEEQSATIPSSHLTVKLENKWSIQENIGHLLDLEPLWSNRIDDILSGKEKLRPTDLANSATDQANHNAQAVQGLLEKFRTARSAFVAKLEVQRTADFDKTALHPRLNTPMSILDIMYFVAEHDDHHLGMMTRIHKKLET